MRNYQEMPRTRSFHKTKVQERKSSSVGETKCSICNFGLAMGASNGQHSENTTYFDFAVKKYHSFIRNVSDSVELSAYDEIKTLENYFESFKLFFQILLLLHSTYSVESE